MRVNSRIRINSAAVDRMNRGAKTALVKTVEALHGKIVQDGVVPRDQGTLEGEAFFVDDSRISQGCVSLVHATPYARRLYFHPEYDFHQEPWEDGKTNKKHDGNPNAKGKWFEDYASGGRYADFVPDTFRTIYRRYMGD